MSVAACKESLVQVIAECETITCRYAGLSTQETAAGEFPTRAAVKCEIKNIGEETKVCTGKLNPAGKLHNDATKALQAKVKATSGARGKAEKAAMRKVMPLPMLEGGWWWFWGFGFGGLGFGVWCLVFGGVGFGCGLLGLGFGAWGFGGAGVGVWGLGFGVWAVGFGFKVWGLGFGFGGWGPVGA